MSFLSRTCRIFLFLGFLPHGSFALTVPDHPSGRVHDEAGLLDQYQRMQIEFKLEAFEKETGNQIVVAVFSSLEGESLEDFSIRLAEKWKIGQAGKDNGIILLVFSKDRRVRIEVGYGLEAVVPDALASRIIEKEIKPKFREGYFYNGIDAALDAVIAATKGTYEPEEGGEPVPWPGLIILAFLTIVISFFLIRAGMFGSFVSALLGGSTFGGSSRSGGSGVGFGGGGGRFGGGGASGSW